MTGRIPSHPLPLSGDFHDPEGYISSLLTFATSSQLFQRLCGGVHILDFLTREPDLYSTILPQTWRKWFELHDVATILDLLMREDDDTLGTLYASSSDSANDTLSTSTWRDGPSPPSSLVNYIQMVRRHALNRNVKQHTEISVRALRADVSLPRHVAVGMKTKKVHEVVHFTRYIDDLVLDIRNTTSHSISHIVDFGSGQNYLGRALASPPYCKKVIALESKQLNIAGAQSMDITAKLMDKEKIMRNKKEYRLGSEPSTLVTEVVDQDVATQYYVDTPELHAAKNTTGVGFATNQIHYVQTFIESGDLSNVISAIQPKNIIGSIQESEPQLLVVSLHSCGNLLHHGLRSLVLNPSVKAVAMIGCCYNLVTERLGPPTFKLPTLRPFNERLERTSSACDPHGFPISERFARYEHQDGVGIRLNITARMLACQAPQNWTEKESDSFFTRHFFRALLQRILVDRGIVHRPEPANSMGNSVGPALIIGSLRKACYTSFKAYVRGATEKLFRDPERGDKIKARMKTLTDKEIELYHENFKAQRKELSIVWSLMAFSAVVVESIIVVDRWQYLREQPDVKECWVEAVFDYRQSPRNLVVVGIKE